MMSHVPQLQQLCIDRSVCKAAGKTTVTAAQCCDPQASEQSSSRILDSLHSFTTALLMGAAGERKQPCTRQSAIVHNGIAHGGSGQMQALQMASRMGCKIDMPWSVCMQVPLALTQRELDGIASTAHFIERGTGQPRHQGSVWTV